MSWLYPLIKTAIAEAALIHTHGNQRKAANVLGIHRFTVSAHYRAYSKWKEGRSQ
ncbi:helix-turn-helix domain-containing protein [Vibrio parahaemolyticus]|uniref:helix-turn-helix domain-containing protein n=1 Tax=Vibrio parahaemolyticus TaxID=670 RepID=UPI001C56D7E7|nr:helix-turn-helix domain-containing protein [Vibrio parahaemolyticus]MDN4708573.1 helix-turn-helix domain-containing protein [Vibrio parahaemolyticus]MDN4720247.1 helix-turn-helix domain-containing protein [Vibrio parahaemolyticus]MDN4720338.1 helix-turn-helix domain-containing protein [Vibrio parahaemolyticus]